MPVALMWRIRQRPAESFLISRNHDRNFEVVLPHRKHIFRRIGLLSSVSCPSLPVPGPSWCFRGHVQAPDTSSIRSKQCPPIRTPACICLPRRTLRFPPAEPDRAEERVCDGSWYAFRFRAVDGTGTNKEAEEKDLVIIGGGVAGYVAAIKAGQEGLKVRILPKTTLLH